MSFLTIHGLNSTYSNSIWQGKPCYPVVSYEALQVTARAVQVITATGIAIAASIYGTIGFQKAFQCKSLKEVLTTIFSQEIPSQGRFVPTSAFSVTQYTPQYEQVEFVNGGAIIRHAPFPVGWITGTLSIITVATAFFASFLEIPYVTKAIEFLVAGIAMRVTNIALAVCAIIKNSVLAIPTIMLLPIKVSAHPNWEMADIAKIEFIFLKYLIFSTVSSLLSIVLPELFSTFAFKSPKDYLEEIYILTFKPETLSQHIAETSDFQKIDLLFQYIQNRFPSLFTLEVQVQFLKNAFFARNTDKNRLETILQAVSEEALQAFLQHTNRTIFIILEQNDVARDYVVQCKQLFNQLERPESERIPVTAHHIDLIFQKTLTSQQTQNFISMLTTHPKDTFVHNCVQRFNGFEKQWSIIEPPREQDPIPSHILLKTAREVEKIAESQILKSNFENVDEEISGRRLVVNWNTRQVVIISRGTWQQSGTFKVFTPALLTNFSSFTASPVAFLETKKSDDKTLQEFKVECEAQRRFSGEGIVPIYFYGELTNSKTDEIKAFNVQPLYNTTLNQPINALKDNPALLQSSAIKDLHKVIRIVMKGIEQIHLQNHLHGDIKPGNILVSRSEADEVTAGLSDCGLVSRQDKWPSSEYGTKPYSDPKFLLDLERLRRNEKGYFAYVGTGFTGWHYALGNQKTQYLSENKIGTYFLNGDLRPADIFALGVTLYQIAEQKFPPWAQWNNNKWEISNDPLEAYLVQHPHASSALPKMATFKVFLHLLILHCVRPPSSRSDIDTLLRLCDSYEPVQDGETQTVLMKLKTNAPIFSYAQGINRIVFQSEWYRS